MSFNRFVFALCWLVLSAFAQETAELCVKQGLAFKAQKNLAEAKAEFRHALELNPKLSAAHFYLAEVLLADRRPQESITELRQIPPSPAVERLLGLSYLELGDPANASIYFAHLSNAEGHYYLGIAFGQQGQLDSAIHQFKLAVRLQPSFGPAHESLGVAFRRRGNPAGALTEFQAATRYLPDSPVTFYDLGLSLKGEGKLPEAEKAFRRALDLKPDFERAQYALALLLNRRAGQSEASAELMQQVRQSHTKRITGAQAQKLFLDGIAQEKLGNTQQAADLFNQAVVLNPDNAGAHMRLGILLARANPADPAALQHLRFAVAADPDFAEAHYNLAKLLSLLNRPNEDPLPELLDCLAIDPAYIAARLLLGNLYADRNDLDHAFSAFRDVLRRDPKSAEAHNNLGLLWLNAGKNEQAAQEFRAALALNPNFQSAQYNLKLALQP